jgi:hypothetical protein
VVDRQFPDTSLAEWYDLFCAWPGRGDFTFYFSSVHDDRVHVSATYTTPA